MSDSLRPHGNSPGQNTLFDLMEFSRSGTLPLLRGIFPTQGLNPGVLHCRQILYQLNYQVSHQGIPKIKGYPSINKIWN